MLYWNKWLPFITDSSKQLKLCVNQNVRMELPVSASIYGWYYDRSHCRDDLKTNNSMLFIAIDMRNNLMFVLLKHKCFVNVSVLIQFQGNPSMWHFKSFPRSLLYRTWFPAFAYFRQVFDTFVKSAYDKSLSWSLMDARLNFHSVYEQSTLAVTILSICLFASRWSIYIYYTSISRLKKWKQCWIVNLPLIWF